AAPPRPVGHLAQGRGAVVRTDDDRHSGPVQAGRERRPAERLLDSGQRRLRLPFAGGEAGVPVLDVVTPAIPVVGPRQYARPPATPPLGPREADRSRAPRRERRRDLPAEGKGLVAEPVPAAVEPDLGHDEWPVLGHVLQAREGGLEHSTVLRADA